MKANRVTKKAAAFFKIPRSTLSLAFSRRSFVSSARSAAVSGSSPLLLGALRVVEGQPVGVLRLASSPEIDPALADEVLTEQIRTAFNANQKVYGSPKIMAELADESVHIGRKRVPRLMREAGIVGRHRRKRSFSITAQNPKADVAPDLVDRKFVATAPNQLWVADVT